ncbi:hypothetical protein GCM10009787_55240 [Streptomyces bangladeshensis]|uniref:Transposase n=1 Tax=Streptomyces bangladeshensis TaxID=295352 RepID=A0ABN3BWL3_9ACTN
MLVVQAPTTFEGQKQALTQVRNRQRARPETGAARTAQLHHQRALLGTVRRVMSGSPRGVPQQR